VPLAAQLMWELHPMIMVHWRSNAMPARKSIYHFLVTAPILREKMI
jgi:hypothetical protein